MSFACGKTALGRRLQSSCGLLLRLQKGKVATEMRNLIMMWVEWGGKERGSRKGLASSGSSLRRGEGGNLKVDDSTDRLPEQGISMLFMCLSV